MKREFRLSGGMESEAEAFFNTEGTEDAGKKEERDPGRKGVAERKAGASSRTPKVRRSREIEEELRVAGRERRQT